MKINSKKRMLARLSEMSHERDPHLADWNKVTDFIRPARGRYLNGDTAEASKRPTSMINSTPYVASRTLSSGMISGASSPSYKWFKFTLDDPDLAKWGPARQALEAREDIIYSILARSNFYPSLQVGYGDSADFGTTCGIIDEHPREVVSMTTFSPGEYVIDVDANGDVNTVYREFTLTVLQLVTKYQARVSRRVKDLFDKSQYQTRIRLVETIEPNTDQDPERADWQGKPWVRFTFERDETREDTSGFLEVSGYHEWPCPNIRWDLASGNKWGWGPGIVAIGDSAALQTLEFRDAQAVEKAVKPPLGAPAQLKNKPIHHTPGGVTFYDPYGANGKIEPLYQMTAGVMQAIDAKIMRAERRINEIYYKDLFLMLATSDRREITAREVEEKHSEKLIALGPVLQRTHRDGLDNAIMRIYSIVERAGLFPPAPDELRERAVGINYVSTLAYAQRAAGAASLERFFGFLGNVGQAYPSLRHKIDEYAGIDYYADAIGVPAPVMVETVKAKKAAAAEQQAAQAAQAGEQAVQGATAAKLLSETDTTRPSALDFVRGRGGM